MGWLAMAFLVSYTLVSPLFGKLADSVSRWWLVGIGVILWSLASGASGFARETALLSGSVIVSGYAALFITRCFVGVGEGAYGPIAPTVISDLYPVRVRGQVLAWFYAAIPVGSALGFGLGGQVAATLGWRWAFYLVTPPGILLGLWCFFMREPLQGQADAGAVVGKRPTRLDDYLELLRTPSYILDCLGMAAMTFALGGLAWWMPDYIVTDRRVGPLFGMVDPRVMFGGLTALAGLTATLLGGIVGDWLRPRLPGSYFIVSGLAMLLGFPMILLVLWTPFPACWIVIFLAVFCLFFNTGPTNTILANVTHPAVRAGAFAVNIFVIHVLGDVISPPIIGFTRDRTGSLYLGFVLVSVMSFVGGLLWLWGARYLEEDTRRAPTRLNVQHE